MARWAGQSAARCPSSGRTAAHGVSAGDRPGPDADFHIHDWSVIERLCGERRHRAGRGFHSRGLGYERSRNPHRVLPPQPRRTRRLRTRQPAAQAGVRDPQHAGPPQQSGRGARRNIEAHYDVGNDFYALWLDETMTYSSALYEADESLADAQRRKYARILSKLGRPSSACLRSAAAGADLAQQAVDQGHAVTGSTISPSQHRFATHIGSAARPKSGSRTIERRAGRSMRSSPSR